jgi:hypothetical protein
MSAAVRSSTSNVLGAIRQLAARQAEPGIVWTAPRSANPPARIDDPVVEHARWLLEAWALRGADSINADLVEETKIAAQLLVRQHVRPS